MPPYDKIREIGELTALIRSRSLQRVLQERKIYLQIEVNRFVWAKDLISAYGELCKLKDIDKTMQAIEKRLKQMKEEK